MLKQSAVSLYLCLALITSSVFAKDIAGSKDHPFITRYPGSEIYYYNTKEFDSLKFITKVNRKTARGTPRSEPELTIKELQGKITRIAYQLPPDRSSLEILTNYKNAIQNAGLKIKLEESQLLGREGRSYSLVHKALGYNLTPGKSYFYCHPLYGVKDDRYLFAAADNGSISISVYVTRCKHMRANYQSASDHLEGPVALIDIVESKQMEDNLVKANADSWLKEIEQEGRASVYGINFETNSAKIQASSQATIQEIVKLLKKKTSLKLYLVGHTDNVGQLDYNLKLSKDRANSVLNELKRADPSFTKRLKAYGVGCLSPKSTNKTDKGRAQNRRVELVEM